MYTYTCNIQYFRRKLYKLSPAPTSPSLLNTHEISYPHPTPNPPPAYTKRMPKYSCLQVYCQSINLKMAIRAETCS